MWFNFDEGAETPHIKAIELHDQDRFTFVNGILREIKLDIPRGKLLQALAELCPGMPLGISVSNPMSIYIRHEDEPHLLETLSEQKQAIKAAFGLK